MQSHRDNAFIPMGDESAFTLVGANYVLLSKQSR